MSEELPQRRGRGRPEFRPTAKLRRTVEEMRSCGELVSAIAASIDIDEKTLRKHFAAELEFGATKCRREVIELLFAHGRKGNVTALKKLEELTRSSLGGGDERGANDIGKKRRAAMTAATAGSGTEWGDDLTAPTRPVN